VLFYRANFQEIFKFLAPMLNEIVISRYLPRAPVSSKWINRKVMCGNRSYR